MKYFKNSELARLYNVSEKSVRNWVNATQEGKMQLDLYQDNGKSFIADTLRNETLLENFTLRAKKYRNSQSHRKVQPLDEFYELYSPKQVLDILTNLETYREIPHQYRYIGPGGIYWTSYLHKLYSTEGKNIMSNGMELLRVSLPQIMSLTESYTKINIIDLGAGNGLTVKSFLGSIHDTGKLQKYIAVDISPELLGIVEHNITTWFDGQFPVETYMRDLTYDNLQDIIAANTAASDERVINIVLLLGGLYPNFRDQHKMIGLIRESMAKDDILLTNTKPDNRTSRKFFDFSTDSTRELPLPPYMQQVPNLLNIDPSLYDVEQEYDPELRARFIKIKLKLAISIVFSHGDINRTLTIEKGERITIWRSWHNTFEEVVQLFSSCGFATLQAATSEDQQFMQLIVKIKQPL